MNNAMLVMSNVMIIVACGTITLACIAVVCFVGRDLIRHWRCDK